MAGRFFLKTLLMLVCVLFLSAGVQYAYEHVVIQKTNIYKTEMQYQEAKDTAHILFFGDSHAALGVNPAYIPESFNYAQPSETVEQTYYKVRKALADGAVAEVFVLPIDPLNFTVNRKNSYIDSWYWSQFISFQELSRLSGKSVGELMVRHVFPFIGNGDMFRYVVEHMEETQILAGWHSGYDRVFDPEAFTQERGLAQARQHVGEMPYAHEPRFIEAFERTLALLNEHGKQTVLIKYPHTAAYVKALELHGFDMDAYYQDIFKRLEPYEVVVLDYQAQYQDQPSLFDDPDHLNVSGAEQFSLLLAEELNSAIMSHK